MPLSRVQGTGKVRSNVSGTLDVTFSTPPSVGNAVLLLVVHRRAAGPIYPNTITDTQGNIYNKSVVSTASTDGAVIYLCPKVTTTGAPFTITLNAGGGVYAAAGVEISGVGNNGLELNQSAVSNVTGPIVNAGPVAALTGDNILLVGVHMVNANQASITVEALTPTWTTEFEELDQTNYTAGEGNTRLLASGALGTTPRAQWTDATAGSTFNVIGAYGPSTPSGGNKKKKRPFKFVRTTSPTGSLIICKSEKL